MGELINLNSITITEPQIPAAIARDAEVASAIANHEAKTDPHPQYLVGVDSFSFIVNAPNIAANIWQPIGNTVIFGEPGKGASWLINVYIQHSAISWHQYCGAGILGAIWWHADETPNPGIEILMEAHNEQEFFCGVRLERGINRGIGVKPSRQVNIASPGFLQIRGVRLQ